jgi:hypothetical protein
MRDDMTQIDTTSISLSGFLGQKPIPAEFSRDKIILFILRLLPLSQFQRYLQKIHLDTLQ